MVDGVATQRQGASEWAPATDVADTVVPAGDYLTYLSAARDITELGTESRGGVEFTRYGFRIDGAAFGQSVVEQMERLGDVPAGTRVSIPSRLVRPMATPRRPVSGAPSTGVSLSHVLLIRPWMTLPQACGRCGRCGRRERLRASEAVELDLVGHGCRPDGNRDGTAGGHHG